MNILLFVWNSLRAERKVIKSCITRTPDAPLMMYCDMSKLRISGLSKSYFDSTFSTITSFASSKLKIMQSCVRPSLFQKPDCVSMILSSTKLHSFLRKSSQCRSLGTSGKQPSTSCKFGSAYTNTLHTFLLRASTICFTSGTLLIFHNWSSVQSSAETFMLLRSVDSPQKYKCTIVIPKVLKRAHNLSSPCMLTMISTKFRASHCFKTPSCAELSVAMGSAR
mmetsp:Transcript_653/g.2138  ORF Transcript_653/g.2138 Transcript_653/m.2138 type:complete len:222 (-) Transcript_653:70-735(-)